MSNVCNRCSSNAETDPTIEATIACQGFNEDDIVTVGGNYHLQPARKYPWVIA